MVKANARVFGNKQIHYHYGSHKRMNDFIMHPDEAHISIRREII